MKRFKNLELYYDVPTDSESGAGVGNDTEVNNETIEQLKIELERIKSENSKEINSLKSQLGHANKTIETYQKNGKSAEELANMEKEKLEKQLKETTDKYNLSLLNTKKTELISEFKIKPQFATFINVSPDMTEENLIILAKDVATKQKEFETEFLKEYSITKTTFTSKSKDINGKDFVDRMIEKNKDQETDLTKF